MKLLIITSKKSEFSDVLCKAFDESTLCMPGELPEKNILEKYDAFAVLGGVDANPLQLFLDEWEVLESQLQRGAKVFLEYTYEFKNYRCTEIKNTRFSKPILMDDTILQTELPCGTLLEEQSNDRIIPKSTGRSCMPILQYADTPEGYYILSDPDSLKADAEYEITIGDVSGKATVAMTTYADGSQIPTLPITLDKYTLQFFSK